jgi:hypothetical protein
VNDEMEKLEMDLHERMFESEYRLRVIGKLEYEKEEL